MQPRNYVAHTVFLGLLLSAASLANAVPRLADGFRSPIFDSTAGVVTPAQDQVDGVYLALGFAATLADTEGLHPGEDWQRNDDMSGRNTSVLAVADGDIVARSGRTILIRHQVPAGTLANGQPSPRLAGAEEIYSVYRNVESVFFATSFNSQIDPDEPPRRVSRGAFLGSIVTREQPQLHFEMRSVEPDFDALWADTFDTEGFYADLEALAAEGLVSPSEFIENHRFIEVARGPQLYFFDTFSGFGQLDLRDGKVTNVSNARLDLTGIAFSPTGVLYGINFRNLYRINLVTDTAIVIGRHQIAGPRSLVFSPTGELFTRDQLFGELHQLDLMTGVSTSLGEIGYQLRGELAFFQGELYAAADLGTGSSSDVLVKLQLQPTLNATEVGEFGFPGVSLLGTPGDGVFYGSASNQVLELDPATGAATVIADYSDQVGLSIGGTSFFSEAGAPRTPLVTSLLPTSRSVTIDSAATAFLSVINAGSTNATGCEIALTFSSDGVQFNYQPTNPATNTPIGNLNEPVDIDAGQIATFLVSFQSSSERAGVAPLRVGCENTELASSVRELNTLTYSVTEESVPDLVALVATPSNDGIMSVDLASGIGAFALAAANVGVDGDILVTLDTGSANKLPIQISLCETDALGQCINGGPTSDLVTTIAANETPTFSIFVIADDSVDFRPERNRVFIRFRDASGALRGSTSVAVRTE